jgi:FkbM family methyltransferase
MKFRVALKAVFPGLYEHIKLRLRRHASKLLNYERDLIVGLCDRQKISLDIGAHQGAYTDLILDRSQGVIAFEPIPFLASALRKKYAKDKRVTICDLALSDQVGKARLRVPVNYPGCSTLEVANAWVANLPATEKINEYEVETTRLDNLQLSNVGFVKIDVEGHEQAVIRGAATMLQQQKPSLYVELDEAHNSGCIPRTAALLREYGYLGYFILQNVLLPAAIFSPEVFQPLDNPMKGKIRINNFFFFHEDAIANVKARHGALVFLDPI